MSDNQATRQGKSQHVMILPTSQSSSDTLASSQQIQQQNKIVMTNDQKFTQLQVDQLYQHAIQNRENLSQQLERSHLQLENLKKASIQNHDSRLNDSTGYHSGEIKNTHELIRKAKKSANYTFGPSSTLATSPSLSQVGVSCEEALSTFVPGNAHYSSTQKSSIIDKKAGVAVGCVGQQQSLLNEVANSAIEQLQVLGERQVSSLFPVKTQTKSNSVSTNDSSTVDVDTLRNMSLAYPKSRRSKTHPRNPTIEPRLLIKPKNQKEDLDQLLLPCREYEAVPNPLSCFDTSPWPIKPAAQFKKYPLIPLPRIRRKLRHLMSKPETEKLELSALSKLAECQTLDVETNDAGLCKKRKLRELIHDTVGAQSNHVIDGNVEEILLDAADEFVEKVTAFASRLAKHRKSSRLEPQDLQLHLEHNWNIRIPGYSSSLARSTRVFLPTANHIQKTSSVAMFKSVKQKKN